MAEHPILFSGEMVRAILDRRKTQTRRVITKVIGIDRTAPIQEALSQKKLSPFYLLRFCPYGELGDRLWVRETFQIVQPWGSVDGEWIGDDIMEIDGRLGHDKPESFPNWWQAVYAADGDYGVWWRPSIFMPRWASRITLEITKVRAEQIKDISRDDSFAEGIAPINPYEIEPALPPGFPAAFPDYSDPHNFFTADPIASYRSLWDKLNAKRGYPWKRNPWVWVLEFKRCN